MNLSTRSRAGVIGARLWILSPTYCGLPGLAEATVGAAL